MEVFGFFNLESTWTTRHWTAAFDDPTFLRSVVNTIALGVGGEPCRNYLLHCSQLLYRADTLYRPRFDRLPLMVAVGTARGLVEPGAALGRSRIG